MRTETALPAALPQLHCVKPGLYRSTDGRVEIRMEADAWGLHRRWVVLLDDVHQATREAFRAARSYARRVGLIAN
ncbi:MAG: hypothetical protein WBC44_05850 [Planctomycetaceae bacterium]